MTEKNIIYSRPTAEESKEICNQDPKFSQKKVKKKKRYRRKHAHSSPTSASLYYEKDGTPKHRSWKRFNSCSNADSPNEAENLQDIIWDPASPPPLRNDQILMSKNEKPVDSVLQWIGDTAIPCTPEIQPRVRRCSSRRQSNNVEDLMKLARQFDLNMTRQHKEINLAKFQKNEGTDCKDLQTVNNLTFTHPKVAKELSHEEELHALFDGPTQHLSGTLSPSSVNCSQESKAEKHATYGTSPATSDCKNLNDNALISESYFDDDWENDDLLSDLLVLEMAQNPQRLSSCSIKTTSQIGFDASKKPTTVSSCGSSSRADSPQSHQVTSYYTGISSETCTSPSIFSSNGVVQSGAIKQLPATSADLRKSNSGDCKVHAVNKRHHTVTTNVGPRDLSLSFQESGNEFDTLWGDGDDNDDDLLYQACDDLERISASQEEQRGNNSSIPSHEVLSSVIISRSSSQHPTDHKQSACVFARSHSIPCTSGIYGNKQNLSEPASTSQVNHSFQNGTKQNNFTQLRHAVVTSGENRHLSTFKRHRSDPGAFRNKVFIAPQPAVKCSAAEIERKKQEAIARRRLRLQTTQKLAAHT
ncbi:ewing's tumor-associated antigen 1 [Silurus asotus]|uniref:Ewing's tumor-associated antigen 1 n=1 Tax=Silurus asotus TaxID=30991 RepID=A0AAD4ZZJ2_SILAS|nr:ewing's tumor-associated antigen 1 [Silurus asotus]